VADEALARAPERAAEAAALARAAAEAAAAASSRSQGSMIEDILGSSTGKTIVREMVEGISGRCADADGRR
jgi:membrane protein involved in colicin uptake